MGGSGEGAYTPAISARVTLRGPGDRYPNSWPHDLGERGDPMLVGAVLERAFGGNPGF